MYLGSWNIDQYLTLAICTKYPGTYDYGGNAVDADADPTYRIYEDETATPIATGTLSKLDDANTLGFYTDRIQLTSAAGFEVGKSYNVYVTYNVSSVVMTELHFFQVAANVAALVGTPIDLGDGATLADNMTSLAGKTGGAASYDRTTDSLEAISDSSTTITLTDIKNLLFKRTVVNRHANEKPQTIQAGDGATLATVTTTIDVNGNIETENYV